MLRSNTFALFFFHAAMNNTVETDSPEINSMASEDASFEAQRAEMAALIERHCGGEERVETAVPGVSLFRGCVADQKACAVVTSVFALIAQGEKRLLVGDETLIYDPRHYMLAAVDLPMSSCVTVASPKAPYLGMAMTIDPLKLAELTAGRQGGGAACRIDRGFGVGRLGQDMQSAALRLLRLLDTPEDIAVLGPIFERELLYRLVTGEHGGLLVQSAATGSHGHQIMRAVRWIKAHLAEPITIDDLANLANMSRSSLHHHFKALTSMTPVQYQKQLRLHEARRLMLADRHDAATAAHRVGYESPSQFSREYRRLFGAPPQRDVAQLRGSGTSAFLQDVNR